MKQCRKYTGRFFGVLAVTAGLVAATACSGSESGGSSAATLEDMDPVVLTWAEMVPEGSVTGSGATAFMSYVEEATDGKVTFEPYWASSLFPAEEAIENVGAGVADIAYFSTSFMPDELPVANWLLGLGVDADPTFPFGLVQGTGATHEFFQTNADLIAELEQHNLKALSTFSTGRYGTLCRDKVTTLAEANGVRTRVGGGAWVAEAEALGMVTQFTPVPEIYEALQRGVLDCVVLPTPSFADMSLWEVAKHFTETHFSPFPGGLRVINLDVWNDFPDEVKQIFAEAAVQELEVNIQGNIDALVRFANEAQSDHDVVFHDATELNEAIAEAQAVERAQLADNAPDTVADPQGFIDTYDGLLEKWATALTDAGVEPFTGEFQEVAAAAATVEWQTALTETLLESVAGE